MSPTGDDDALMGSRGGGSTWGGDNGAASPTSTRALSRAGGSYQSLAVGVDSPMGNAARGNTPHHGDDDADHVSKKEKRAVRRAQMAEGRATRLKRDLAKAQNALAREQSYKNEAYSKLNALRDGGVVDDLIRSSVTPRSMTGSANASLIGPISALRPVQQWQDRYIRASDNCDLAMKDNEELRALLRSVSRERSGGEIVGFTRYTVRPWVLDVLCSDKQFVCAHICRCTDTLLPPITLSLHRTCLLLLGWDRCPSRVCPERAAGIAARCHSCNVLTAGELAAKWQPLEHSGCPSQP